MHIATEVRVRCKAEVDQEIDAAVAEVRGSAPADATCGVLVTRHDFDHFSVALSSDVPFGLIYEQDNLCR